MKGVGEVIAVNYNLFIIKTNCICGLTVSEQKRAYCLRESFFDVCKYRNQLYLSMGCITIRFFLFCICNAGCDS